MPTDKMTLAWLLEHAFDNNQNGEIAELANNLHSVAVAALGLLTQVRDNGGLSFGDECALRGLGERLKELEGPLVPKCPLLDLFNGGVV